MASIRLDRITKVFDGRVVAVDGVSLDVEDGELFVLLGPSGSGKTTVLRIVAGLERPTRGRVYIDGVDVTDLPPRKRDVAMVFQTWALYPHMKVYDNIAFPLRVRKTDPREVKRRVTEVAELLGITELLDRYPRQLSGGQQQRVALARALVRNPKAWLMDEPLSNLDALLRVQMRVEIRKLQKELGITTIYVTHDQVEAMSMADRIAVFKDGRLQQVGSPLDIYTRPSNTFVASFIGSPPMNLIEGEIEVSETPIFRSLDGALEAELPLKLFEALSAAGYNGGRIVLGFRPEDARLESPIPGSLRLAGEVIHSEVLGSETIVNVNIGGVIAKVKVAGVRAYAPGMRIDISIGQDKIRFFEYNTGKLLV